MERKRRHLSCAAALIFGLIHASAAQGAGVYQWRDADGNLHFGDDPAPEQNAKDLSAEYNHRLPFEIVIEGVDYRVPPQVRDRITTYVRKIFTVYNQALELEYPQSRQFLIKIYGSEAAYRKYQRKVAPILENSAGFYNSDTNQITTWGMDEEQLIRLITHECSHAISASHGRYIPTWLNEGLAEYFEQMNVAGLGASVPVSRYWVRVLQRHGYVQRSPNVQQIMDSLHQDWYSANGADGVSYAVSWSLVWFLMDSRNGRSIIEQILTTPHSPDHPNSSSFIQRSWPGGIAAFTEEWRDWLREAQGTHRY
ncbi:MAG: DUF4124 domain-containing protein [Alcanivoracaceae bacterium]|nr:DUF4124 domain-containing protein [Alcanivoracaceae bacterium]